MNNNSHQPRGISITLRTALCSWGVALATLLCFALAIVPQQRRDFEEHLRSKAHGVAVSLRDVAAGSVVNEDFSSVVDHCGEMLKGDKTLEYLVITKNDGFSLISDRTGWRSEPNTGPEWRPARRVASSGIGQVSIFNRRVYHHAQPFDYQGIEWGWIHVGLSLEGYDRSVAAVYQRTALLAVGCMLFSLAASGLYARWLVRPILSLRNVVQRLTGGDLTARAEILRHDELGTLSTSVNLMTDALLRRDRILESVRIAAQQFLCAPDWRSVISEILAQIGAGADVSRIRVFQIEKDAADRPGAVLRHEWASPALGDSRLDPAGARLALSAGVIGRWGALLARGESVNLNLSELAGEDRESLGSHGFKSVLVMPILVDTELWGALSLAECRFERQWTGAERDSIRAAADMLGATIARQRARDALVEAKETLEQRVRERTRELQEQVQEKDRANSQLAAAQQQLMDVSRQAGMAEVATGVLHNVGNVLNSVNVSANLVHDRLGRLRAEQLCKVTAMLRENEQDVGRFLDQDPKGRLIPAFLGSFSEHLLQLREKLREEIRLLIKHIEHIKEIVAMQQNYARVAGVLEDLPPAALVEDALMMHTGAFSHDGIKVHREFASVPPVRVDKHKVLQILINLFRNAKYAMTTSGTPEKVLNIRVGMNGGDRVKIEVNDNGVGIPPENLTRIFQHGFTTKPTGHGFGLHSGACAAKALGGSLMALSDGSGKGATFILELPIATRKETQHAERN
jgi:signal transduction histidine kinase